MPTLKYWDVETGSYIRLPGPQGPPGPPGPISDASPRGHLASKMGPVSQITCAGNTYVLMLSGVTLLAGRRYRFSGSGSGRVNPAVSTAYDMYIADYTGIPGVPGLFHMFQEKTVDIANQISTPYPTGSFVYHVAPLTDFPLNVNLIGTCSPGVMTVDANTCFLLVEDIGPQ